MKLATTSLQRWLLFGEWRAHPLRALAAIAAIALGVALGCAIDLINGAAFNEFTAAAKSLSGQSDLQVLGMGARFSENFYPLLASHAGVRTANPVLEIDTTVPGQTGVLKILGIDVFRAATLAPDLIGMPAPDKPFDTLADDAIFLSPAAQQWLHVTSGDHVALQSGTASVTLRVAGGLVRARPGQRIAVMDIAAAQWRFGRLGQLSRIDLKLADGVTRAVFRDALAREFAGRLQVTESIDKETRTANMSRAYRVNLNVLALVALFTGAFLVFSTQALSVLRRRAQFALLRVMGMTRGMLLRQVLLEGSVLGILGALLGLAAGYGLAATALRYFGGDLGGGYFPGVRPSLQFNPLTALLFFILGSGIAVLGSLAPALEAAAAAPAPALKSGSEDVALARLAKPWPALLCLVLGALLSQLPPVSDLPVFGYLAVGLLLVGTIALMPRTAAVVFALTRRGNPRHPVMMLALARLANAPNQASIALGGVLSSFSLMVAMAIMVSSFRVSVDDWLVQLLSADLYVRAAAAGDTGVFSPPELQQLRALPGVQRADFLNTVPLLLNPARPAVALIARPIDSAAPQRTLPLTDAVLDVSQLGSDTLPIWVSEAMVDLYGYRLGQRVQLPIGRTPQTFLVAGVWRDYARQSGSIQMRLSDYQRLSGDMAVSSVALFLTPGTPTANTIKALRALSFGAGLEVADAGDIRAMSLKIFDRSFAVTYLLEVVAIVIGLFGVAATFSAQTLARAKEFGMLRHVGVTRRQVLLVIGTEGTLLTALGIAVGFLLGWVISLVLIFVVNPQSFHWTMQLHMPWRMLVSVATLLLLSSALTAVLAGVRAVAGDAVRAVREDW